jgi:hypothetical protein
MQAEQCQVTLRHSYRRLYLRGVEDLMKFVLSRKKACLTIICRSVCTSVLASHFVESQIHVHSSSSAAEYEEEPPPPTHTKLNLAG